MEISVDSSRSYATEANLDKAIKRLGLDDYRMGDPKFAPCRYIKCRNTEGRWTAVFLVSEFFNRNNTGGYLGFASPFAAV